MLRVEAIPAFTDNYIWLLYDAGLNGVVVDPGEAGVVEDYLAENKIELQGLIITHHHADHTGGIAELTANRDIPVYGPENPAIKGITQTVKGGDSLNLLGTDFDILATPGHTLDHLAFFASPEGRSPVLFCGDTLFSGGCGRLFEGTAEQMQNSLDRLRQLPGETEVYCAHEYTQANLQFAVAVEPENQALKERVREVEQLRAENLRTVPSRIGLERMTNPFLRTSEPEVIAAAKARGTVSVINNPRQEADVLGIIREWKDNF
ncbi:MAG: hydroxyacylglutathione hydrolase [Endozoicomonas sp.]